MSSPEDTPSVKKARFVYRKPDDYEPVYVNGVYGGITPRGELLAHFFIEYSDIPLQESYDVKDNELDQDSRIVDHRHDRQEGEVVYTRDIRTGILIPAHQIQSMIKWMQEKLDIIMEAQKKYQEESADVSPDT